MDELKPLTAGEYGSYGERLHAEAAQIAESRKHAQDKGEAERLQHDLEGLQGRPTISEYSARIVVCVMESMSSTSSTALKPSSIEAKSVELS